MSRDNREAIVALRAIAAVAEKLADDLQNNRLWEGERDLAIGQIGAYLRSVPRERP